MARSIPAHAKSTGTSTGTDRTSLDLAGEVADLLHQVNHRIRRVASNEFEPLGVTSAQMRAMRRLVGHDAPMRMSELAESLGIARRSATSVIDDLAASGLVERVDDPSDRRVVGVRLTPAGRSTMAKARGRRRSAAGQVLGELTELELKTLRALLQRLLC